MVASCVCIHAMSYPNIGVFRLRGPADVVTAPALLRRLHHDGDPEQRRLVHVVRDAELVSLRLKRQVCAPQYAL